MGARWHRYSLMNTNNNTIDANATGLALLIIMFWGDPDIADAIIHFLMSVPQ